MNISKQKEEISSLEDYEVFDNRDLMNVLVHSGLSLVGMVSNSVALVTAFRTMSRPETRCKTNVHYLVFQLILADSLVSFITMPMEAVWRYTIQWYADNLTCKILMMIRTGGYYLSSNILVVLCVDRYISISRPFTALHVNRQRKRARLMICLAWLFSILLSAPQE